MSDVDYSADVSADNSAAPPDLTSGEAAPVSGDGSLPASETASQDQILKDVWDQMQGVDEGRHRDEFGRFARQQNDQARTAEQGQAQPATQPPQFWSAEAKAHWDQLPPGLQQEIVHRDREVQEFISRQGNEIGEYRQYADTWEHARGALNYFGMDDRQGFDTAVSYLAQAAEDPIGAIVRAANDLGVDLYQALGVTPQHGVSPDMAAIYAQVNDLQRQLAQNQQQVQWREQAEQRQRLAALENQVVEFSRDKPDFEQKAPYLIPWIEQIRQENPDAHPNDVLQWAYEAASWGVPAFREQALQEHMRAQEQARVAEAQKRAKEARNGQALHVKSSPANMANPKSHDDLLSETWKRLNS
jgi:hypothetical protein